MFKSEDQQHLVAKENLQIDYFTKVFHWKIDFRGTMDVPSSINFNPRHYIGTQNDYDNIYNNYLKGKEDQFKVIGEYKFESFESLENSFPIRTFCSRK